MTDLQISASIISVLLILLGALVLYRYARHQPKYTTHEINRDCLGRTTKGPMATRDR